MLDLDKYVPWDTDKPVFSNFRANTVGKAFFLNALATALIAWVTVEIRFLIEENSQIENEALCIFITLFSGFAAALLIFGILFVLFNFGGGMMVEDGSAPVKAKI